MSRFDADWLRLREPADVRARDTAGTARLWRPGATPGPLRVLDLACGTGANLRYLAPRIGGVQDWLLVDADARLLAALPAAMARWASAQGYRLGEGGGGLSVAGPGFRSRLRLQRLDLASRLEDLPLEGYRLITASALLDLVSKEWLEAVLTRCRNAGADLLFALTYDGGTDLQPADAGDDRITALVNAHQRGDKGFGPALGPAATDIAEAIMGSRGYRVARRSSDWRIGPGERGLQEAILRGWRQAASEQLPRLRPSLDAWLARRLALVAGGRSRLRVGHQDLLGSADGRAQGRKYSGSRETP